MKRLLALADAVSILSLEKMGKTISLQKLSHYRTFEPQSPQSAPRKPLLCVLRALSGKNSGMYGGEEIIRRLCLIPSGIFPCDGCRQNRSDIRQIEATIF